jgi:hypothetical protein
VATYFPDRDKYFNRPGRFGAHNIVENIASEGPWKDLVFLTYFNAGLRVVNVSDPLVPNRRARRTSSRTTSAPTSTGACT